MGQYFLIRPSCPAMNILANASQQKKAFFDQGEHSQFIS